MLPDIVSYNYPCGCVVIGFPPLASKCPNHGVSMKVGTLLLILHDVIEGLLSEKLLLPTGDFVGPNLNQDLQIVTMVENAAKAHGVVVQSEVDKIIQALPLVMMFAR